MDGSIIKGSIICDGQFKVLINIRFFSCSDCYYYLHENKQIYTNDTDEQVSTWHWLFLLIFVIGGIVLCVCVKEHIPWEYVRGVFVWGAQNG